MADEPLLQAKAQVCRGLARIPDYSRHAEIVGEPSAGRRTFETPPLGRFLNRAWRGKSIYGAGRSDQLWCHLQHQTGLGLAGMKTMQQFFFRQQISQTFNSTPEETRQNGQRWAASPQLSGRHLKQTDLAAMSIEQNKALQPHPRQLPAHLVDQIQKQRRRKAEGSGEVLVLRRKADGLTRQSPNRQSRIKPA